MPSNTRALRVVWNGRLVTIATDWHVKVTFMSYGDMKVRLVSPDDIET